MGNKLKYSALLPVLVSNFYSAYGVLCLNWSVADLFFWFWFEFILAGVTAFALTRLWLRAHKESTQKHGVTSGGLFVFSFSLTLFYATLFAALAYRGEWKDWDRFPEFLAGKLVGLITTVASFAFYFARTLLKGDCVTESYDTLEAPYGRRAWIVLGLYLVFLLHGWIGEWTTGGRSLELSSVYLKGMAVALIALKAFAEAGLIDRFIKRPRKRTS